MRKASEAFRTISEVSAELDVPKHVLRFWESRFPQIRPMKRGGGRRYYRPEDVALLHGIRQLLHASGYTIKGVQKILREQGVDAVKRLSRDTAQLGLADERATATTAASAAPGAAQRSRLRSASGVPSPLPTEAVNVVRSIIAELEACFSILKGDARGESSPSVKARQGPSR